MSKTEIGLLDHEPRVVTGFRGIKNKPLRKRFATAAAMLKWFDSEDFSNCEIHTVERAD